MSIFKYASQTVDEQPIDQVAPVFGQIKQHKSENIIPPIGIAKPELADSFQQNFEDEDKILQDIADTEAYERETPFQTGTREVAAHGARALEGFLGGVGGFLNLLTPELHITEEGELYPPGEEPQGFPSAHQLREKTKELTGKYLEPKGEFSGASQEVVSDIGSMFSTPGLGFFSKILIPLGGQATKQVLKGSGVGETGQDIGKLGFMALSSLAHLGNAPAVARNAMNQARDMIPQGLFLNARDTMGGLQRLKNQPWYRTGTDATKAPAIQMIERIENQIQNGMIEGQSAMQLRIDLNRARKQLGGFQLNPVPDRAAARHYLDEVDRALLASMENYGTRANPQWWNTYQRANQAFAVTQRSNQISEFVQQHARPLQSNMAKSLFHVGAASGLIKLPAIAGAAIPVAAAAKTIQVMNRMIRSPVLRNHYLEVVRQASLGNSAAMNKALQKFDKEAEKFENYSKK